MPLSDHHYRRTPMLDTINVGENIIFALDHITRSKQSTKRFAFIPINDKDVEELTQQNNHMYEILPPDMPVKLYFDLEMVRDNFTQDEMNHCCEEFIYFMACEIQKVFGITLTMKNNDIVIQDSCRKNKLSFHIIINQQLFFSSVSDVKLFIQYLRLRFENPETEDERQTVELLTYSTDKGERRFIFDCVPYSSYQNFRFMGQSKIGSEHVLINHTPYWMGIDTFVRLYSPPNSKEMVQRSHLETLLKKYAQTQAITKKIEKQREGMHHCANSNQGVFNTIGETLQDKQGIPTENLIKLPMWKRCLYLIPNTVQDQIVYRNVAMAVKGAGGDLETFLDWAKISNKYTGANWARSNWAKLNTQERNERCYATPFLRSLAIQCKPEYFRGADTTLDRYFELNTDGVHVIKETSKFVSQEGTSNADDIFHPAKHLILHAYLGRGKTTAIKRLLNNYTSYLFLSSRQTFATFVASEFDDSCCYLDCNVAEYNHPRFIISIESLHKIKKKDYDIVCLDESESLLAQFSSTTMQGNQLETWNILSEIIKNAKKVVYADAFLTTRTIDVVRHFANQTNDQITLIQNETSPVERKVKEIIPDVFCQTLLDKVKNNKKIYACYSSANKLVKDVNRLKGAAMENEQVEKKMNDALIYHSKVDDSTFESLKTINQSWHSSSMVITSPSNTVGCSYSPDEPPDFHEIMVNAFPTCTVRDSFQTFARVRHLKDNQMTFCFPTAQQLNFCKRRFNLQFDLFDEYEKYCIDKKDTMSAIIYKLIDVRKQQDETDSCSNLRAILKTHQEHTETPEVLRRLYYFNLYEETVSAIHYVKMFKCFLRKCGYVQEDVGKKKELSDMKENELDGSLAMLIFKEERYENVHVFKNDNERDFVAQAIRAKRATAIQKLQMRKYWFDKLVSTTAYTEEERSLLFHRVYQTTHGEKYIKNLRMFHDDKVHRVMERDYLESFELNNMHGSQLAIIKDINQILGLIIHPVVEKQIISREQIDNLLPYLQKNKKLIYTTFKLRNRLKDQELINARTAGFIIKAIYSEWCGASFSSFKMKKTPNAYHVKNIHFVNFSKSLF